MHTVNKRTQLICCVFLIYGVGALSVTQPYGGHATSVYIYPLGSHVVRSSATEQLDYQILEDIPFLANFKPIFLNNLSEDF